MAEGNEKTSLSPEQDNTGPVSQPGGRWAQVSYWPTPPLVLEMWHCLTKEVQVLSMIYAASCMYKWARLARNWLKFVSLKYFRLKLSWEQIHLLNNWKGKPKAIAIATWRTHRLLSLGAGHVSLLQILTGWFYSGYSKNTVINYSIGFLMMSCSINNFAWFFM